MKKLIMLFLFILVGFGAFSQYPQVYYNAVQLMREKGYSVADANSFYGNIKQGEIIYANKTFYSGFKYAIVAISEDGDVRDIDAYLYYLNGELLIKDTNIDDVAIIYLEPSYDITMQVQCKNYRSDTPNYASRCWILIGFYQ